MFQSSIVKSLLLTAIASTALGQTPAGFVPSVQEPLTVTYGKNQISPPGELIPRPETANPPSITSSVFGSTGRAILFMIDRDVPQNGTRVTLLHWFVPNVTLDFDGPYLSIPIPENTTTDGAPYLQPSPPVGDSPHTYTFLLFSQPGNFTVPSEFESINPPAGVTARIGFSISAFVEAAGLQAPLAASYMQVQNLTGVTGTATTFPPLVVTSTPTSSPSSSISCAVRP